MANSNNVYETAQPLQGNVSDWLQNREAADFAYRDEQRKIAAIDAARVAKQQQKNEALKNEVFGKIPKNYDTGSASLNEFNGKLFLQAVNRKGEIYKRLKDPSISDEERIKLEIENQNLDNLPENLQVATKGFSSIIDDYQKGVSAGQYFRNPDFEKKVLSGFENYVGGLDNGLPVVGFMDRDGDGQVDVLPYETLSQGIGPNNSNMPWQFQRQVDLDKLAVATGEKLGTTKRTTDGNYVKQTITGPDLNSLNTITDNIMQNPDGSLTDAAKSELKKRGLNESPENIAEIKRIFKERVLAYTDRSNETDVDYAGMNAAARLRFDANKSNKKSGSGKGQKEYSLNDLALTARTKATKDGKSRYTDNIYQGNVDIVRESGNAKEKFRGFAVDDNGDVIVTVDVPAKTETGNVVETKKYNSKDNADIVAFFAQRFKDPETNEYIENIGQLRDKLQTLGSAPTGKQESAAERALRIANGG